MHSLQVIHVRIHIAPVLNHRGLALSIIVEMQDVHSIVYVVCIYQLYYLVAVQYVLGSGLQHTAQLLYLLRPDPGMVVRELYLCQVITAAVAQLLQLTSRFPGIRPPSVLRQVAYRVICVCGIVKDRQFIFPVCISAV